MNIKDLTPEEISKDIYEIIEDRLGVRGSDIAPEKDLEKDLGADSLDSVELIMAIEQKFDIRIPDDAVENIKTVGDIVAFVNNLATK